MDSWPPPPPFFKLFAEESEFIPPAPPRPIEGQYEMFGASYSTKFVSPSLEESGVQRLTTSDGADAVSDLRKQMRTALCLYVDLVLGMSQGEPQDERLAVLEKVFLNMHFIVNSHRPQQAMDAFLAMMKQGVAERKRMSKEIDDACKEAELVLETFENEPDVKKIKREN